MFVFYKNKGLFIDFNFLIIYICIEPKIINMKQITINIQDSKFKAFFEFIKTLEYVSISENTELSVSEQHKIIVRTRVKKSKSEELLDWNKVKGKLNGI